jgi:membrane protease YdiL (CAAX protease family)
MNKNIIELILLIISFAIYFIWYTIFITSSNYDINSVSNLELGLGIFGFICGLWLSSYLHRTIFKDKVDNTKHISFIIVIGIIAITLMGCAIIANIYNVKGVENIDWIKYNQILFPLYGGIILISEESVNNIIYYISSHTENNSESSYSSFSTEVI